MSANVSGEPAVSVVGKPVSFSELAAAAWTTMLSSVPMMVAVRGIGRRDRLRAGGLERHGKRMAALRRPEVKV